MNAERIAYHEAGRCGNARVSYTGGRGACDARVGAHGWIASASIRGAMLSRLLS